jgi:hypothetical protein
MMTVLDKCNIPKDCLSKSEEGLCKAGIVCDPIVEKCNGCNKIEDSYCKSYPRPSAMWRTSQVCPLASHVMYQDPKFIAEKLRIGQQKQKKK